MTAPSHRLRSTWPVYPRQSVQPLCGWAALTVVWHGIGTLLTGPLADGSIVRADEHVAHWLHFGAPVEQASAVLATESPAANTSVHPTSRSHT